MPKTKTCAWLLCALLSASVPGWAADDLLTIQLIEEARQWQDKERDDLAAELWRKLLRTNPKHQEALVKLAGIEARAGNLKESEALLSRVGAVPKPVAPVKALSAKAPPDKPPTTTLGELDVMVREKPVAPKPTAPNPSEPTLEPLQTADLLKNWLASRRSLEKLVQAHPTDQRYAVALASHLTYRESTRREGLRRLGELASRGQGTDASRTIWRKALLALRAGPKDVELFGAYLQKFPDEPVILERHRSLGGTAVKQAATSAPVPVPALVPAPPPPTSNQTKAVALLESGRAQMKIGDEDALARARTQFENGMLLDPANVPIRLELARVYQALGLLDRAASLLDSVLDSMLGSQPDFADALYTRALLYDAQHNASNGLELLERMPVGARTTERAKLQQKMWVNVQVQRARQLFAVANFKQAPALMQQAQEGVRQDAALTALVAAGWSDLGQSSKALVLMRTPLNTNATQSTEMRLKYAEVLLNAQQDAELLALLKELSAPGALRADQQKDLNQIILGYTLRVTEGLREAGRLAEAVEVLNPALQRIDDVRLLLVMARIYRSAGNLDAAMELVERVIVREPNGLAHRLFASEVALVGNDLDRAQAYAKFALELSPDHPRALTAMGRVEKARGNTAKALEYFQKSQAQENKRDEFPAALGLLAIRLASDTNLTKTSQRDRDAPGEVARSGLLPLPDFGIRKEPVPVAVSSADPANQMRIGRAFLAEGELLSAANSYAEVLKVTPLDPIALNNMGVVKVAAGEYLAALQLLTQASKIAPQRGDIQDNLFQLQAWTRAFMGVKAPSSGFDLYIPAPPQLWPPVREEPATIAQPSKLMNSDCPKKPCK